MRIVKLLFTSFVFVAFVFSNTPFAQDQKRQGRLSYTDGGSYDLSWGGGPERMREQWIEVRKFIWKSWVNRQSAKLILTLHTIEGDPTVNHLYFEYNQKGEFILVREYKRYCCWSYALEKRKRKQEIRVGKEVYEVMDLLKADRQPYELMNEKEIPDFTQAIIRFRKKGNETNSEFDFIL